MRKIIAAVVAGLMLVMSFAEVPAVFAAGETGDEPEVVDELNGEKAPEEVIDPETEGEPEVIEGEPEEEAYVNRQCGRGAAEAMGAVPE